MATVGRGIQLWTQWTKPPAPNSALAKPSEFASREPGERDSQISSATGQNLGTCDSHNQPTEVPNRSPGHWTRPGRRSLSCLVLNRSYPAPPTQGVVQGHFGPLLGLQGATPLNNEPTSSYPTVKFSGKDIQMRFPKNDNFLRWEPVPIIYLAICH